MRRVHGVFRLGVCAAALVAFDARAESYRLVEPTLSAAQVQNGQIFERQQHVSSRGLIGLWLVGGTGELGLEELNAELARHGWSTAGSTEKTLGFGGTVASGPWYVGLILDGAPNGIVGPNGESGNVGVLRFSGQLGWQAYADGVLSLAPFFAFGASTINVIGRTSDPGAYPLFSGQVRFERAGFAVHRSTGFSEFGMGAQTLVPAFGTDTRNGPAVGVQLGYRAGLFQDHWHSRDSNLVIRDPETLQDGFFVRFLIGWAWSSANRETSVARVDRCAGPRCWVECNPGFADCDFDPRNGCESPEGLCRDPSTIIIEE